MRRRSVLLALLIIVLAVAAVAGVLGILVKQEPDFYAARTSDEFEDTQIASQVLTRFGDLTQDIRLKPEWNGSFTAVELDAFLRENLQEDGWLAGVLPPELHDSRVAIDGDRLKVAGRLGNGFWSTVVCAELRVWLVKDELNTVAVELVDMKAGALPVELQWFRSLNSVAEAARDRNIDVSWYRNNGHLVGVFKLYADQPRPPTLLRIVQVSDGRVIVAGRKVGESALTPDKE